MKLKAVLAVVAVASGLMLANVGSAAQSTYEVSPEKLGDRSALSKKAISDRLEKTGKVCLEGDNSCGGTAAAPAAASGPRDAKTLYTNTCAACHGTGAMNAPKLGDKAAWAPRVSQGAETMLKHALGGFNMMPPKGGCADCSDAEIKGVVEYFISEAK